MLLPPSLEEKLKAITLQNHTIIYLLTLHLLISKAFDRVDGTNLLKGVSKIIGNDELHIINTMLDTELTELTISVLNN